MLSTNSTGDLEINLERERKKKEKNRNGEKKREPALTESMIVTQKFFTGERKLKLNVQSFGVKKKKKL